MLKPPAQTPRQKHHQQQPQKLCQLLTLYQKKLFGFAKEKCIRNYGLMMTQKYLQNKGPQLLRHVLLLQGKLGLLAARDPGDHGLCRATQQGDSFGQHSPLPVVPPFARWPFLSRQLSVWKCSMVAFCSWPWKCFASFYLPRLILFPV